MARMTKRNSAELEHSDHDISPKQMKFIEGELLKSTPQGFFIARVDLPASVGTAPNALYGPAAGDPPVKESEVFYSNRGSGRAWEDRLVSWPTRRINYVHAIGIRNGDELRLFTVYGGPLAPQHPDDPTNGDPEGSRKWWSQHALSGAQWAPKNNPRSRRNSYDYWSWTPPSVVDAMSRERDVYHRAYDDAVAAGLTPAAAKKHAESVLKALMGARKTRRGGRMVSNPADYTLAELASVLSAAISQADTAIDSMDSMEAVREIRLVEYQLREMGLDHMADLLAKAMTAGSMDEYKVEYMLHRVAGTESPRKLNDAQRIKFERAFHAMPPRR